jgi:Glyoxalase/Bleomycin resistance protein/Dioxygenase superfamily
MHATLIGPELRAFYQVAYVTTDIDEAAALFRSRFGVPEFLIWRDAGVSVSTPNGAGSMWIDVGFAWVGTTQFELIQPKSGLISFFADFLPERGFAMAFHHVAFEVTGDEDAWWRFRKQQGERHRIAMEGPREHFVKFFYTDQREYLGHHFEYVWFTEEGRRAFDEVPRY